MPVNKSQPHHSNLEVRLLQDADQLVGCLAPVCKRAKLLEDILDQLHVVLPHRLELGLLKLLVSLGNLINTKTSPVSGKGIHNI